MSTKQRRERINELSESIISQDSAKIERLLKEELASINFDDLYCSVLNSLNGYFNAGNSEKAVKLKGFINILAKAFFSKRDDYKLMLADIKNKRDITQELFREMIDALSPDDVNFNNKKEIMGILNLFPSCIDEIFENNIVYLYAILQLSSGVVYADNISASNKGAAPRRPDPSKQKAIDEAIILWKRTPRLSLDDVAGLIRDAEISDKSHSIIKQWIAPFNPKRKK
jgi:hypothetical protein